MHSQTSGISVMSSILGRMSDSDDSDDYYNNDKEFDNAIEDDYQDIAPLQPQTCPSFPPQGDPMITDTDEMAWPFPCRDVLETAKLVYGYVSPYDDVATSTKFNWQALLGYLGFAANLSELSVSKLDEGLSLI